MIDSATLEEELNWKNQRFNSSLARLENDEVPSDRIPITLGNLADNALGIAICRSLAGSSNTAAEWFTTAVEYYVQMFDATLEHEDEIEGSYKAHRPKYCADLLHAALLAGTELDAAVERTLSIDEEWYLDTYPEFAHVFHYVRALALLLSDAPDDARIEIERYDELEDTPELYHAATGCVAGMIDGDREAIAESIDRLLTHHRDQRGQDPSTAVDFVSIEASALFECAQQRGNSLTVEALEDEHVDYLLTI